MPICPRCGKCLSSEQALTYHLNRKYKCGTWNCVKCLTNFNTKFQLQIHEMECLRTLTKDSGGYPTTELMFQIYNTAPIVCIHLSADKRIDLVSPQSLHMFNIPPESLIGLSQAQCIEHIKKSNECVIHNKDTFMFYVSKKTI